MTLNYSIRPARIDDGPAMVALLPRLTDFDVPENRNPDHLWQGDRALLQTWLTEQSDHISVNVAVDASDNVLGLTIVSLGEELISHLPNAHLEVIVLDPAAQGQGVSTALIETAQNEARARGALSMSLHVFSNNQRARRLYEKAGFEGELMRYFKPL